MEIYKIICIALTVAILCFYLKSINSEFFSLTLICGGIIILTLTLTYLNTAFDFFKNLFSKTGANTELFNIIIKVTLVAYLIEFACNLIEDLGIKSLSDKVAFAGKILLICMSAPVFNSLIELITNFLA